MSTPEFPQHHEEDVQQTALQAEQTVAQALLAVSPSEFYEAMQEIEQSEYTIGPYTGESRLKRIQQAYEGRENEVIPLDELEKLFEGTSNARRNAQDTLSWLNKKLRENNRNLEFERVTGYRLRKKVA